MPNPQGDDAVRWCAAPRDGSLAWRLREDGGDVVRTTSLKDPNKKHQKNHPFLLVKQGQSIGNFRDFWWNGAEWNEKMTTSWNIRWTERSPHTNKIRNKKCTELY